MKIDATSDAAFGPRPSVLREIGGAEPSPMPPFPPQRRPKVGVGVIIIQDGKILLGKRKNTHGAGEWSLPGGHLEWQEGFDECCAREVQEETGLVIGRVVPFSFINHPWPELDKHYVTLFFRAHVAGGELRNPEPERNEGFQWFPLDALPSPLFECLGDVLRDGGIFVGR